jgi:hypothetical protein
LRAASILRRRFWGVLLFATVLAGLGLSSSAGLNAYLPLLILALADRATSTVNLDKPYDLLSSTWGIIILLLLLPIELIADKFPRADHLNDLLHTVLSPAAGHFAGRCGAFQVPSARGPRHRGQSSPAACDVASHAAMAATPQAACTIRLMSSLSPRPRGSPRSCWRPR